MFGEKTRRLQKLMKAGFPVPALFAISTKDIARDSDDLAAEALRELKAERFAVRSSALVEDANQSSMAGQFLTRLDVSRANLAAAIDAVRDDAKEKLGSLNQFSIFIQEFIEADYSGVAFTRNPSGDRDTVIEYHAGRGDAVVGGEVKPTQGRFFRTQTELKSALPDIAAALRLFLRIEELFDSPQDIEWCLKDDKWYVLQSRPITNLTKTSTEALEQLERELPLGHFYFAKTEVCDVAPRPSLPTLELLRAMYAAGGPVDTAYRSFGVFYRDTEFLRTFNGELFVDKERELQSLFSSHSYFHDATYTPRPVRLKGFLESLKNTKRLQQIAGDREALAQDLRRRLDTPLQKTSEQAARTAFLQDYELVFRINLLTQRNLEILRSSLPKTINLTQALSYFPGELSPLWDAPQGLVGNTFEFGDRSRLVSTLKAKVSTKIPSEISLPALIEAQEYLRLREYGRWLALKHINNLRGYHKIEKTDGEYCSTLPVTITDRLLLQKANAPLGVSSGIATGKLVIRPEAGGILVVSSLTPDIAEHAKSLKGVIADHGGLLSHFAIIAREMGLPVIVQYPIHTLKMGETVTMDGATGEVV